MTKIYKTAELAKELNVPSYTIQSWIRSGTVPSYYNDTGRCYFTLELVDAIKIWRATGNAWPMQVIANRDMLSNAKTTQRIVDPERVHTILKNIKKEARRRKRVAEKADAYHCGFCGLIYDGYRVERDEDVFCSIRCQTNADKFGKPSVFQNTENVEVRQIS